MLSLSASSEELLDSFNTQNQAPDDPCTQDFWYVPRDFVDMSLHVSHVLAMLLTKHDTRYLLLQLLSPDSDRTSYNAIGHCLIQTSHGLSFSFVVHGLHLKINVVCVDSSGLGSSWCFLECFFQRCFASPLYIPLCMYHFPKRHMMCNHF